MQPIVLHLGELEAAAVRAAHMNNVSLSSQKLCKDKITVILDPLSSTRGQVHIRTRSRRRSTVAKLSSRSGDSCPFSDTVVPAREDHDQLPVIATTAKKDLKPRMNDVSFFVPTISRARRGTDKREDVEVGPKAWPIVGTIPELWQNYERMHDWLLEYFQKGLTFSAPMPTNTYFFTADPAVCEHILKTNFSNYPKGEFFGDILDEFLGDGIFNSDGERWKQQRKVMNGEVQRKVLRYYSSAAYRKRARILASIVTRASYAPKSLEMQDLFKRMTLDTIVEVASGVDVGALSHDLPKVPFQTAFDEANVNVHLRFVDPLWRVRRLFNLGTEARFGDAVKYMDEFLYNVIRNRRQEIALSNSKSTQLMKDGEVLTDHEEGKLIVRADLVSRFILVDENVTDKSIRDDVLSFIMAGRDSTSSVLAWFIYCLTSNAEVAEKIFDEVCAFEARHQQPTSRPFLDSDMSESDFNEKIQQFLDLLTFEEVTSSTSNFQYLHAAITETIRLYPVVPQDVKGVLQDDVLPSGHKVQKGDLVAFVPYAMGRLTSLWGPDALDYKPERWLNKDGVFVAASPFKFTAFQAGPRSCLGKDAAFLQMKTVLAVLCRFFKFKLVPGHKINYRMSAILMLTDGMHVTVSRRTSPACQKQ